MSTIPLRVLIWGISILALLGNSVVLLVLLGTEQDISFKGRIHVMSYYTFGLGHFHILLVWSLVVIFTIIYTMYIRKICIFVNHLIVNVKIVTVLVLCALYFSNYIL